MIRLTLAATAAMSLAVAGCGTLGTDPVHLQVADRLYLGGSSPSGPIAETEWDAFVAEVVTPLFPEGLTLWRAQGQWRELNGDLTREPVLVVEILHDGSPQDDDRLQQIATAYKTRFNQEAVVRSTARIRGRFIR